MLTARSPKFILNMGPVSNALVPTALLSLITVLSACSGNANGVQLGGTPSSAGAASDSPSTSVGDGKGDPALKLTESEILSQYSGSSCDSLSSSGDGPVFDDDRTNGVNDGNLPDYQRGLRGKVYTPPLLFSSGDWWNLNRFLQPDALPLPNVLYFFNLNVPTRSFSKGFPLFDGSLLQGLDNQPLLEFFRIDFDGFVELGDGDAEGDYELAMLSDDGATLDIGINGDRVIDSPDATQTKLMCATQAVPFKQGFSQPVMLHWFQGPKYHIANMMLWRKKSATAEPLCGASGNDLWFDYNAGPYVKKQAFKDLETRGWKVIGAKNFRLPLSEPMNPCSSPRVQKVFSQQAAQ